MIPLRSNAVSVVRMLNSLGCERVFVKRLLNTTLTHTAQDIHTPHIQRKTQSYSSSMQAVAPVFFSHIAAGVILLCFVYFGVACIYLIVFIIHVFFALI